jgi:hypothetical protein
MFVNRSELNEQSLKRTFEGCFLPFTKFRFIWPSGFRGEDLFRNQPIRNKNCLWWPCLLMDRDEKSNVYRGHDLDASYQVSVHLIKRFPRRRLKCEKLTDDGRQVMAKAHIERWAKNDKRQSTIGDKALPIKLKIEQQEHQYKSGSPLVRHSICSTSHTRRVMINRHEHHLTWQSCRTPVVGK